MALNFDVSNITDYQNITTSPLSKDSWHPVTHYLVFSLMSIGINEIKAGNVDEVFRRVAMQQRIDGPALEYYIPPVEIYLTRQDIVNHIGLHTNVSNMTAAEFNKKTLKVFEALALLQCDSVLSAFGQVAKVAHERSLLKEQEAA